jgi:hypothetical protein
MVLLLMGALAYGGGKDKKSFTTRSGATMWEYEEMESQPNRPQTHFRGGFVSMASEGYIQTQIHVAQTGDYQMELVASGT